MPVHNADIARIFEEMADLDARIHEIAATGHCAALDRLRQSLPPAITELLRVPGLGPKRVKALYHELDVVIAAVHSRFDLSRERQTERLDLLDTHCRMAKEEGVLVSVNSDAHSVLEFDNLKFGIGQARRGWLEKDDVLNTRGLAEVRRLLARKGAGKTTARGARHA
jgi:hypothetical protein